jgi:quinol monooxygenase YgiN
VLAFFGITNVKPEYVKAFTDATISEARVTVSGEPGVFQFHILADKDNPDRFYYFEIFRDEDAAKTHWETENFKTWWSTVESMLDGEMQKVSTMQTVFPSDEELEIQKAAILNW